MERETNERIASMKRRVDDRNWNDDAARLVGRVNEARALDSHAREETLAEALDGQDARILNLATAIASFLAEKAATTPGLPPGLASYFETLLDADERNQLGTGGHCMLIMVRDCIVERLLAERDDLTDARLRRYLEGDVGRRAALDAFLAALEGVPGLLRRSRTDDERRDA
jgi:hypothetical protein